jgi:hypothetical protein
LRSTSILSVSTRRPGCAFRAFKTTRRAAGVDPRLQHRLDRLFQPSRRPADAGDDLIAHWERRSAKALERMHPDKLDRAKLMYLVEKYGYDDIAAALRKRGGLPDPEQAYLTGNVENIDDFSACKITRKEDWIEL